MIFYRVVLATQTSIDTQYASIIAKPLNSYQAILNNTDRQINSFMVKFKLKWV